MTLLKSLEDMDANGKKGDWCFLNEHQLIALRYGDDPFLGLVILPILCNVTGKFFKAEATGRPFWNWDGNEEQPTLTPSILVHGVPEWNTGWHGFLRAGKLETV